MGFLNYQQVTSLTSDRSLQFWIEVYHIQILLFYLHKCIKKSRRHVKRCQCTLIARDFHCRAVCLFFFKRSQNPNQRGHLKRKWIIFQTSIFRGYSLEVAGLWINKRRPTIPQQGKCSCLVNSMIAAVACVSRVLVSPAIYSVLYKTAENKQVPWAPFFFWEDENHVHVLFGNSFIFFSCGEKRQPTCCFCTICRGGLRHLCKMLVLLLQPSSLAIHCHWFGNATWDAKWSGCTFNQGYRGHLG